MATANFYYENILVTANAQDEWDADDAVMGLQRGLESRVGGWSCDEPDHDSPRSFPGRVIWEDRLDKEYADGSLIYAELQVIARSGYYEGINFDYRIERDVETEEVTETKAMEAKLQAMVNRIERTIREHGLELRRVATFSNGETVYEPAK